MRTECIITGVLLIHPDEDVAYHGDLFEQGDTYIVNCNEQSAHTPPEDMPPEVRWIQPNYNFWECKGVWVFKHADSLLSDAALRYIEKVRDL